MIDGDSFSKRVTYYDRLCDCYKLKDDANTNIIQKLGKLETLFDCIYNVLNNDSDNEHKIRLINDFIKLGGSENDYN
ncbi:MAG TPA: hypothetical protein DHV37_05945 [Erysipelotrichaceae bacterium]|nr:hypothetical protein [Erysipelotrichaceae bacterium]